MFQVQFNTDNAAFENDPGAEIAEILRVVALKVKSAGVGSGPVFDGNGNRIGQFETNHNCMIEIAD